MNQHYGKTIAAGVAGTMVMTMMGMWVAPMMGMAPMNPAAMLAGAMGGMALAGWAAHFMIGIVLAFAFVSIASRLPGPGMVRGALFSVAPWLLAQTMMMPMMGMPLFSGSATTAMGSLVGHLLYGLVIGAVVGHVARQPALVASRA